MYLSVETQNKMYTYKMDGGKINPEIAYRAETLAEPNNIRARQAASTVHVHPNGRFLYGSNRAQDTVDFEGKKVFKGGENSIVVYSINQTTGEPTQIQNIETRMIHPRTFHIDPSGRMLVAQHNLPVLVREGNEVKTVSAGFRCFASAPTASSTSCASTTSTSATSSCSGWGWCRCSERAAAPETGGRVDFSHPPPRAAYFFISSFIIAPSFFISSFFIIPSFFIRPSSSRRLSSFHLSASCRLSSSCRLRHRRPSSETATQPAKTIVNSVFINFSSKVCAGDGVAPARRLPPFTGRRRFIDATWHSLRTAGNLTLTLYRPLACMLRWAPPVAQRQR
jgi:hypothetical protein